MNLVLALVVIVSSQGNMQVRARVPKALCGLSGPVEMLPIGRAPIKGNVKIRCGNG
jgi:hypothetical protein